MPSKPIEWEEDGWSCRALRVVEYGYEGSQDFGVAVRESHPKHAPEGRVVVLWSDGCADDIDDEGLVAGHGEHIITFSRRIGEMRDILRKYREASDEPV